VTEMEHLMTVTMEECCEVAHRIAKAKRFGMEQVQHLPDDKPEDNPGLLTNRERILREYYDLRASLGMIGIDAWDMSDRARRFEFAKTQKIQKYLLIAHDLGTLR